ncbi:hypothetical protein [Thiobacillus denitrificans]|uniref:hypothetical protein n=1 Tax=Thiobacillus denitrificans TaxID=36861 RepID=UPI00036D920A|nr:hypothetical protein [Thiobacillus denitrificans]
MNAPKKDPNAHRARKRSFQANLEPEEDALVNQVKALRRVTTDRGLLLALCRDEIARRPRQNSKAKKKVSQQDFLRAAMKRLGLQRKAFAERIDVKPRTFNNWLLPDTSKQFRRMPDHVRVLVDAILNT